MREATTIAITVAMKKNQKNNQTSARKLARGINPALLKTDFLTITEKWWKDTYESLILNSPWMDQLSVTIGFAYLKRFIKQKKPEQLGLAVLWNPYLIHHPDIRGQIIIWISLSKSTLFTGEKAFKKYIEPFAKSLIPKAVKTPTKVKDLALFEEKHGVRPEVLYD